MAKDERVFNMTRENENENLLYIGVCGIVHDERKEEILQRLKIDDRCVGNAPKNNLPLGDALQQM